MSIAATNWVWALTEDDLPNEKDQPARGTLKLVLMKHADHAHADGTHTWQSIESVAKAALCSKRTAQRANAWLIEHGFMREGDQSVIPDHYDVRTRPIAYELAMSEATRQEWEALNAAGSNPIRSAAQAAGAKGGRASAQVKRGDNLSPQEVVSSRTESGGADLAPQEQGLGGDRNTTSGVPSTESGGDSVGTQTTHKQNQTPAALSSVAIEPSGDGPPAAPVGAAETNDADQPKSNKRGTRLPEPFVPTAAMRDWVVENAPHINAWDQHQRFVDYWRGVPGQRGVKLDWEGTWRNWMRRAEDDAPGSLRPTAPRRGDIDWEAAAARAAERDAAGGDPMGQIGSGA
jgi:hypothetical protein